jgi:hypothetical protein
VASGGQITLAILLLFWVSFPSPKLNQSTPLGCGGAADGAPRCRWNHLPPPMTIVALYPLSVSPVLPSRGCFCVWSNDSLANRCPFTMCVKEIKFSLIECVKEVKFSDSFIALWFYYSCGSSILYNRVHEHRLTMASPWCSLLPQDGGVKIFITCLISCSHVRSHGYLSCTTCKNLFYCFVMCFSELQSRWPTAGKFYMIVSVRCSMLERWKFNITMNAICNSDSSFMSHGVVSILIKHER